MKNQKASTRFNSPKAAENFASKVNGEVRDLRSHAERKSDFKVVYEKCSKKDSDNSDGYDFDSGLNMNGMHWHDSDDL